MATILEVIQSLEFAVKSMQMYTAQHPRAQAAIQSVRQNIETWIGDKPSLHLAVAQDKIFADSVKVEGQSPHMSAMSKRFAERMIAGFIIQKNVAEPDIIAMLDLLTLKPAKIEELGGPTQILESKGVTGIRVSQTRYKEIGEGDGGQEGEEAAPAPIPSPGFDAGEDATASVPELLPTPGPPEHLVNIVREALSGILTMSVPAAGSGDSGLLLSKIQPAFLGNLGPLGYQLGLGEGMPSMAQMAVLRQVIEGLPPESQLSLLGGLATLPAKPEGLALGVRELSPIILSQAVITLLQQGIPWSHLQGILQDILRPLSDRESLARALSIRMREAGLDGDLAEALLRRMDWEALSLEAKVVRALEEGQLWDLSLEQRLAFLRELLDEDRSAAFLRILDRILETLQMEDASLRLAAAQTLAGIAHWARHPGLPRDGEDTLLQKLQTHFTFEPQASVHRNTTEALSAILAAIIWRGELAHGQAGLTELRDLCGILDTIPPWRQEGLDQLHTRLCQPDLLGRVMEILCESDKELAASEIIPYLEWLGPESASALMAKLGNESDRTRRGRIIEALRTLGPAAVPVVRLSLQDPAWYLVRNALNLLGDLGDAGSLGEVIPLMRHRDGRVRRAAVRAAWKLGGPTSEPHLVAILKDTDPETQFEILFALGQINATNSAPVVVELAEDRRASERLRLKALETLGQIGSTPTIPLLIELIKRKGFFGAVSESFDIRLGVAKALQGIGSPEARWALQKLVESQGKGPERIAMQRVLDGFGRK